MRALIFFLSVGLIFSCSKKGSGGAENEMPELPFSLLSGEQKMANQLSGKSILIFYSPDCDHCQREAQDFQKHISAFRNYSIYFISASLPEDARLFAQTYGLQEEKNITFALATYEDVVRTLGPMPTPTVYIYSHDKKLVKKFEGETSVEEMIPYL